MLTMMLCKLQKITCLRFNLKVQVEWGHGWVEVKVEVSHEEV
jgi:hypothetical protein